MSTDNKSTNIDVKPSINKSKKSIKWLSVPYFPVSSKYLMLAVIIFFIGIFGTSLSKFEALALCFVTYSVAIVLDRAENTINYVAALVTHGNRHE
jgi:hypothetical protein